MTEEFKVGDRVEIFEYLSNNSTGKTGTIVEILPSIMSIFPYKVSVDGGKHPITGCKSGELKRIK